MAQKSILLMLKENTDSVDKRSSLLPEVNTLAYCRRNGEAEKGLYD